MDNLTRATNMTPFKELPFSDDFMFCKILGNDVALCKEVIEICTGIEVGNITYLNGQQSIRVTSDGRGVRLDILLEDDRNQAFDLEMETKNRGTLPERTAFYLGMMGRRQLRAGDSFQKLKDNYVIFIMPFNIYPDVGRHRYTFQATCQEDTNILLKDRSTSIFICAKGKDDMDDVPEGLRAFLNYVLDGTVSNDLTRRLDVAVRQAQANEAWEQEYMELWMKYNEFREDGIEIGRKVGIEIGREEGRAEGREEGRKAEQKNTEKERLAKEQAQAKVRELEAEISKLKGMLDS